MGLKIVVLAKQVPDTRNVGKDAMKADGTVNRAALPAIYNPEDLHALEQALALKERYKGSTITVVTMGPPRAADILRESLYRGADDGYLVTDRRFAGADTIATSYVLSKVLEKIKDYDVVFAGRQAIDGDTAQVGPQVAEKLAIPQITYAEKIVSADNKKIVVKRRLERGYEIVEAPMPLVVTVHSSADRCRPKSAKLVMKYKYAKTETEIQSSDDDYLNLYNDKAYLKLKELNVDDLNCDLEKIGLAGSPTKVKAIENVVLESKDSKVLTGADEDIKNLMAELINNHTLG